jgi:hypothetical protein
MAVEVKTIPFGGVTSNLWPSQLAPRKLESLVGRVVTNSLVVPQVYCDETERGWRRSRCATIRINTAEVKDRPSRSVIAE